MPKSRFVIVVVALAIGATFASHAHACGAELITLVETQNSKGVKILLTQGCSDLEYRNKSGDTAVLIAARNGALDTLEALVGAGAKINVLDPKKRDVLNIAITTKNPALARKALALGADPTLVTSVYDGGAIIYGSAKGSVEIVKLLIDAGAPVNRVNNIGWTALLEVAVLGDGSQSYRRIAQMLVAAGADRTIADKAGKTPYDHAQARGHGQLARILALPWVSGLGDDLVWKAVMKVLLVEDDRTIADAIVRSVGKSEFRIDHVDCLAEAETALQTMDISMVILDLGLPDGDGLRFLKSLRRDGHQQPVIILTARDRVNDRVNGLDGGADDYLSKPFDMTELMARLRAIGRRQAGRAANSIEYERIRLLPDHQTTFLDDEAIELPVSQFRLLQYLLEEQGRVKTKQQIIDALYSWDQNVEENTIEVYISQLRKSLWKDLIRTVRGIGYSIPPSVQTR